MKRIKIVANNPQTGNCSDISKYIGQEFDIYEENIYENHIKMIKPNNPDYIITIWNEEFEFVN